MPEISRFLGIVIRMYFFDHDPPHFHAKYGDDEVQIRLAPLGVLNGQLPPHALALVLEWSRLHVSELHDNWRRLHEDEPAVRIAPLE